MSTHTLGPWTIEDDASECVVSRDPEANEFHIVARTYGPDDAANARLIASAPDLLAELKWISGRIDRNSGSPNFTSDEHDRIVAAIAKAEGVR